MLAVYYKVYREAMKQKKSMERTNNIRTIPLNRNCVKNSFENDKATTELLGQSNSSDLEAQKANMMSPAELERSNSASEPRHAQAKRISVESAMMEARMKARNSIFVTSGSNILEGCLVSHLPVTMDIFTMKYFFSSQGTKESEHLLEERTQGLCNTWSGDGNLHPLLAALLYMVSHHHDMWGLLLLSTRSCLSTFLDWSVSQISD